MHNKVGWITLDAGSSLQTLIDVSGFGVIFDKVTIA